MNKYLSFLAFMLPSFAIAQDAALYDAPPPADAAFVRFIGLEDDKVSWEGLNFNLTDNPKHAYFIVHAPQVGREIGEFINILPNNNVVVEPNKDQAKVMIGLVNISDRNVNLRTSDGMVEIVKTVEPHSIGWREVNPVSVNVQVFAGDIAHGEAVSLELTRGAHRTIVVTTDGVDSISSAYAPSVVE